jgi:hypothetical protein
LASSRDTSNGPDWKDVATSLAHYEDEWQATVELIMRPTLNHGQRDMQVVLTAAPIWAVNGEVPRSVLRSVLLSHSGLKTLEAAITYLLLSVDFALVEENWVKPNK